MTTCLTCSQNTAAAALGICGPCLRQHPELAAEAALSAHKKSRQPLAPVPPRSKGGAVCRACANSCRLAPGETGYCGLRENRDGYIHAAAGHAKRGLVTWYHDPLPTNCVADWVCPAGSSSGYPHYSYCPGEEYGYSNLAVFFGGCSFDCLFCQNRDYHQMVIEKSPTAGPEELVEAVRPKTACICFFGGDPSPQLAFALKAGRLAKERFRDRILRICWETNGSFNPKHLKPLAEITLSSGGCIKFDLKAWDENLHQALTGVSNRHTLANFAALAEYCSQRPDPPFLVASTLLVPGYVDQKEVAAIAAFIAGLNPDIPYSLLAFYPRHLMSDLPLTARKEAESCRSAALSAGLKRVHLGNVHLLR